MLSGVEHEKSFITSRPEVKTNKTFKRKIVNIFLPISFNICKSRLVEMALMSAHNICFGLAIRKYFIITHSYLGA